MQEAARLRELEAECRQHALREPEKKWYWLAQAAKYQTQANQKSPFTLKKATPPTLRKSNWLTGRLAAMNDG